MSLQDLGALGEFLGFFAVVITLIYLAVQTRQNTQAIRSQVEAIRSANRLQFGLTTAGSKEIGEAWFEDEDELRAYRRRLHGLTMLQMSEWEFHQWTRGIVAPYEQHQTHMGRLFQLYPGLDQVWAGSQSAFTSEFISWVEEQRAKAA